MALDKISFASGMIGGGNPLETPWQLSLSVRTTRPCGSTNRNQKTVISCSSVRHCLTRNSRRRQMKPQGVKKR